MHDDDFRRTAILKRSLNFFFLAFCSVIYQNLLHRWVYIAVSSSKLLFRQFCEKLLHITFKGVILPQSWHLLAVLSAFHVIGIQIRDYVFRVRQAFHLLQEGLMACLSRVHFFVGVIFRENSQKIAKTLVAPTVCWSNPFELFITLFEKKCFQQSWLHFNFANLSVCPLVPLLFSSNVNNSCSLIPISVTSKI